MQVSIGYNHYPNSRGTLVKKVLKHLKALQIKVKKTTFENVAIDKINDEYKSEQLMNFSTTIVMEKNTKDFCISINF